VLQGLHGRVFSRAPGGLTHRVALGPVVVKRGPSFSPFCSGLNKTKSICKCALKDPRLCYGKRGDSTNRTLGDLPVITVFTSGGGARSGGQRGLCYKNEQLGITNLYMDS